MSDNAGKATREIASLEIAQLLEAMVKRAENTAAELREKTMGVTRDESPEIAGTKSEGPRAMPPLFSRYRELIWSITASLNQMDDTIRRCEL